MLQAHAEGSSLRGIARTTGLAYNTVVSVVRAASQRSQQVHKGKVQAVSTDDVSADQMWSFVKKKQKHCVPTELEVGDCWMAITLANTSGLILACRVGKHTDSF